MHQMWHVIYFWNTLKNYVYKYIECASNSKKWIYTKPSNLFLALVLRDLLYGCGNNGNGWQERDQGWDNPPKVSNPFQFVYIYIYIYIIMVCVIWDIYIL